MLGSMSKTIFKSTAAEFACICSDLEVIFFYSPVQSYRFRLVLPMLMLCEYDMDPEHKDLSIQRILEEISQLIRFELNGEMLFQVAMIPLLDLIVRF